VTSSSTSLSWSQTSKVISLAYWSLVKIWASRRASPVRRPVVARTAHAEGSRRRRGGIARQS
jgi:hypothetical protein